jgi:hypothetical protein
MKNERRRHTRVPLQFEAFVKLRRKKIPVSTLNLSMRGMRCSVDPLFIEGDACTVIFVLSSEITFQIRGSIVRTGKNQTGIHFESMDEDSFFHLKKLVQYNASDPDTIDREFSLQRTP